MPVHLQRAYAGKFATDPHGLRVTESIADEILSLPMYPELSDAMVAEVVGAVRSLI